MNEQIQKAIEMLNHGGVIIFPTDTAFAIGCRIDRSEVIKRLFNIRKRPLNQPVLVLVNGLEMAQEYLEPLNGAVKELMKKYWPGALTIVYKCKTDKVYPLIRGNGKTLGVRMPDHNIVPELIKGVGVPILGPSANFHGGKTPYSLEDLDPILVKLADFILEGKTNEIGKASTVIDCSINPWKIIRQGTVRIDL